MLSIPFFASVSVIGAHDLTSLAPHASILFYSIQAIYFHLFFYIISVHMVIQIYYNKMIWIWQLFPLWTLSSSLKVTLFKISALFTNILNLQITWYYIYIFMSVMCGQGFWTNQSTILKPILVYLSIQLI